MLGTLLATASLLQFPKLTSSSAKVSPEPQAYQAVEIVLNKWSRDLHALMLIFLGSKTARYPPCFLVIWKILCQKHSDFRTFSWYFLITSSTNLLILILCHGNPTNPSTLKAAPSTICSAWGKVFWWYSNSWGKWARKAPVEATYRLGQASGIASSYGWCCLVIGKAIPT